MMILKVAAGMLIVAAILMIVDCVLGIRIKYKTLKGDDE